MLNLQAVLFLSASGLRCKAEKHAASRRHDIQRGIHDFKQHAIIPRSVPRVSPPRRV